MAEREMTATEMAAAKALLELLPALEAEGFEAAPSWGGGERSPGVFQMSYPKYCEEIQRFIELAHDPAIVDRDYVDKSVGSRFGRVGFIEQASLDEVKSMLTFMVRGERFCDGHIAGLFDEGHVVAVLQRLRQLAGS